MYGPAPHGHGVIPAGGQYRGSPVHNGAVSVVPYQQPMAPAAAAAGAAFHHPGYRPVQVPHGMHYTSLPPPQQAVAYGSNAQVRSPPSGSAYAPRNNGAARPPHKGTLPPGQMVRVGHHTVRVERYLSEGGYAHVYLTSSERPIYPPKRSTDTKGRWGEKGFTQHCLKRIAFSEEGVWTDVSKEIEVMKALPASQHLIQYLDSSHHRLPNGTYEVFILMEVCSGGGIIDLLNKRLRDRLKEIEILNIFTDVCEAVAAMHALARPLLHRDLKIENVLSHPNGMPPTPQRPTPLVYKLCDFGSTTFPASHPPSSKAEADALAVDLNKHTTLQYRSPEMVEPMLGWAVGLPSDVWALGVLLYKLCYYTTPFEEHGTLAIVNAKYTFPQYPVYSPRLQHLIASMLVEHPLRRPSVFDVLRTAHEMSGTRPEVDYPSSMPRSMPQQLPPSPKKSKSKGNMLDFTETGAPQPVAAPQPDIPDIQPQRRGRPNRDSTKAAASPASQPPGSSGPESRSAQASRPRLNLTGENKGPSLNLGGANLQYSSTISGHGSRNTRQSYGPSSRPAPGKLNIPAERSGGRASDKSSPSPQNSVDAFGVPKHRQSSGSRSSTASPVDAFGVPKPSRGFTDTFGAPPGRTTPSPSAGFGDAFGMPGKVPFVKSPLSTGFGDTFAQSFSGASAKAADSRQAQAGRSVSGFSDTFSTATSPTEPTRVVSGSRSKQPSPSSPRKARQLSASSSGQSSKTERRSSSAASTLPEGNMSFEQRYPSIDELSGDGPSSPKDSDSSDDKPSPPPKSSSTQEFRRASIATANRTGDGRPTYRQSNATQPQPRSTHVTGTAFKGELKPPLQRSDSTSPTADYLSMLDNEVEEEAHRAQPEDLMGDDDELRAQLAPLRPTTSSDSRASAVSPVPPPPAKQQQPKPPKPESLRVHPSSPDRTPRKLGAAERATLPPISSARPQTNFNSDNWSPLETMRSGGGATERPHSPTRSSAQPRGASKTSDSSDDEPEPPESATWRGPPAQDRAQGRQQRPVSMFVPSNPGTAARRRSITDMVSKYERMSVGAGGASAHGAHGGQTQPQVRAGGRTGVGAGTNASASASANTQNGHASAHGQGTGTGRDKSKPPSVAKPAALRHQPSDLSAAAGGEERRAEHDHHSEVETSPKHGHGHGERKKPSAPAKPAALRQKDATSPGRSSAPGSAASASAPASGVASGQAPAASSAPAASVASASPPSASSTSQSRTAASSAPKAAPAFRSAVGEKPQGKPRSRSRSRSSSPEKQQPVNLLIQRWNRGTGN